jgi:hypothetical protein
MALFSFAPTKDSIHKVDASGSVEEVEKLILDSISHG